MLGGKKPLQLLVSFLFLLTAAILLPLKAFALERIALTPSSVTLTEGQSQTINVTLDEPIICADPGPPCQVSIAVSSNAPERLQIVTSPIVFGSTQWAQIFSFTITAVDDGIVNGNVTPTITTLATSGSEYYSNFSPSFAVHILDNDVNAPAQTTPLASPAVSKPVLPDTGSNSHTILYAAILLIGAGMLLSGFVVTATRKKK